MSYDLKTILLTGSLRSPPLWWLRHHLSPASGGTTNRVKLRVTYERIASRSFVLPLLAGEVPRSGQGGMPFRRPSGRLYGFSRQRRLKNGARKGTHLASAAVLYNSRGRSPQPVREASAGPGQNPWRPGPSGPAAPSTLTPVRACQPSGILASTALRRSRSRPRRRAPEPSSPTGRIPQRWEKISSAPVSSSTSRSQCLFSASFLILSASFGTITLSV